MDGKKYNWCEKYGNWSTTHDTQSHGDEGNRNYKKNNLGAETNLVSFEPDVWIMEVEEPTSPLTVLT